MSLLHLLTHYSKENKALYNQQKAAQGKPKQAVSKPSKPAKTEKARQSVGKKPELCGSGCGAKGQRNRALRSPDSRPRPCSR